MPVRSLSVSQQFIEQVRDSVAQRGLTQTQLASELGVSRSSVVKFLSGQNVDRRIFVRCCTALEIDWDVISGTNKSQAQNTHDTKATANNSKKLIRDIRNNVKADIHARCSTMRVLDMEQPIGIEDIYTNVNILEKLSGRQRLSLDELLANYDSENFDRFLIGQVRNERVSGVDAVERYNKLIILGKPGAGKTTFMKRLATLCNYGEFQPHCVPVFVTLKEFTEADGHPRLQDYIARQWDLCGVNDAEALVKILNQGCALILLDGLDEVRASDRDRVLRNINAFTNEFRYCRFVITCRIAAQDYIFQLFTEVEIADFTLDQIAEFAIKWFSTKKDPEKSKLFIQQLSENIPIQELATNPLLLTLLCLVFSEAADFPSNRSELYKEGLDVLLKKWDAKRNIERNQIYKRLSLKRKEDLLSQLALSTFERGDYFFKEAVVERQISNYIRNLPGAKDDEETLRLDSSDILKSIEAQHGLLVERARGIYSFSHLTFQEYFSAKQITRPTAQLHKTLIELTNHITEKRYREIFLLAVGMLPEADDLLNLMKQKVDQLLMNDLRLQEFLQWVNQKSNSTNIATRKTFAIRAFYFSFDHERAHYKDLDDALDLDLYRDADQVLDLNQAIELYKSINLDLDLYHSLYQAFELDITVESTLKKAISRTSDPKLKQSLKTLKEQFPNTDNHEVWEEWWKDLGEQWTQNLRSAMIVHCSIGQDWQFTNKQKEKLRQFYGANKLIVDCLNSDCYVTKATRQEIEDTLLLPISEIEKRKKK